MFWLVAVVNFEINNTEAPSCAWPTHHWLSLSSVPLLLNRIPFLCCWYNSLIFVFIALFFCHLPTLCLLPSPHCPPPTHQELYKLKRKIVPVYNPLTFFFHKCKTFYSNLNEAFFKKGLLQLLPFLLNRTESVHTVSISTEQTCLYEIRRNRTVHHLGFIQ